MMAKRATFEDAKTLRKLRRQRRQQPLPRCSNCQHTTFEITFHQTNYVTFVAGRHGNSQAVEKEGERTIAGAFCAQCGEPLSPEETATLWKRGL